MQPQLLTIIEPVDMNILYARASGAIRPAALAQAIPRRSEIEPDLHARRGRSKIHEASPPEDIGHGRHQSIGNWKVITIIGSIAIFNGILSGSYIVQYGKKLGWGPMGAERYGKI